MNLSGTERWILSNQYHILEKLTKNKSQAAEYAHYREILESGYEALYPNLVDRVLEKTLSPEACKEVQDVLVMYLHLQGALRSPVRQVGN